MKAQSNKSVSFSFSKSTVTIAPSTRLYNISNDNDDEYAIVYPDNITACWYDDSDGEVFVTSKTLEDEPEDVQMQYYATSCINYWDGHNFVQHVIDWGTGNLNWWEIDLDSFSPIEILVAADDDPRSDEYAAAQDKGHFYIIRGTSAMQEDVLADLTVYSKEKYTLDEFTAIFRQVAGLDRQEF
ncbi:MAG: hypothetical protein HUU43_10480 [Ignavibacteriaceae bacterium]|nr:hypothetical protein [Ignavibacteriaceae bacterium]NUM71265.1 hypothetical protein [Ignavibacteriaceae bacterium]